MKSKGKYSGAKGLDFVESDPLDELLLWDFSLCCPPLLYSAQPPPLGSHCLLGLPCSAPALSAPAPPLRPQIHACLHTFHTFPGVTRYMGTLPLTDMHSQVQLCFACRHACVQTWAFTQALAQAHVPAQLCSTPLSGKVGTPGDSPRWRSSARFRVWPAAFHSPTGCR